MKKRLVAVLLSVALCMATVVEAGAAAFDSQSDVYVGEAADGLDSDVFSDVAGLPVEEEIIPEEDAPEQNDTAAEAEEDLPVTSEIPEGNRIDEELPAPTEIQSEEPAADVELQDPGEEIPEEAEELPEEDTEELELEFDDGTDFAAGEISSNGLISGEVTVAPEDWVEVNGGFMLRKQNVMPAAGAASENGEVSDLSEEDTYYTSEDGIIRVNTVTEEGTHTGCYLFNENGIMVTDRTTVEPGTPGYELNTEEELYFTEKENAEFYAGYEGSSVTPVTTDIGQQKTNYWLWTGSAFHYYDSTGRDVSMSELGVVNKIQNIEGNYYCLSAEGVPRTGYLTLPTGTSTAQYYFQPAANAQDIPGKMFCAGWFCTTGTKGERWLYYSPEAATLGQLRTHGVTVTTLDTSVKGTSTYLLDKYGYILKNTMKKAENGAYYCSNSKGVIYKNKLVKYKNYRYYFESDGKRATWTKRWHQCPGANNRMYYFGSTPGRVVEKRGWQKVKTAAGKFYGWYYFDKNGNCYINRQINGYYFNEKGKLASGKTTIGKKTYFFEVSSSTKHRGKMLKKTLISYKGKWYYASANGTLRKSGWQKVDGNYYYFKNYTAVKNTFIKKNGVNGYLDSKGKFCTGWLTVSNSKNQVRYIDSKGNGFLKNTSRWIDGLLYYFDKDGYRINDLTGIYKGPYSLVVDRVNGVMTVYNSNRTIPVKSIRVSVGMPNTPTPLGTYTLTRSLRFQPLMGPCYGQYGTHVTGGIFIHSIPGPVGSGPSIYSFQAGEYYRLGFPASHGCIRTCVADAKWVFENCNGATITIKDGVKVEGNAMQGPLGKNPLVPLKTTALDPTDPLAP